MDILLYVLSLFSGKNDIFCDLCLIVIRWFECDDICSVFKVSRFFISYKAVYCKKSASILLCIRRKKMFSVNVSFQVGEIKRKEIKLQKLIFSSWLHHFNFIWMSNSIQMNRFIWRKIAERKRFNFVNGSFILHGLGVRVLKKRKPHALSYDTFTLKIVS